MHKNMLDIVAYTYDKNENLVKVVKPDAAVTYRYNDDPHSAKVRLTIHDSGPREP